MKIENLFCCTRPQSENETYAESGSELSLSRNQAKLENSPSVLARQNSEESLNEIEIQLNKVTFTQASTTTTHQRDQDPTDFLLSLTSEQLGEWTKNFPSTLNAVCARVDRGLIQAKIADTTAKFEIVRREIVNLEVLTENLKREIEDLQQQSNELLSQLAEVSSKSDLQYGKVQEKRAKYDGELEKEAVENSETSAQAITNVQSNKNLLRSKKEFESEKNVLTDYTYDQEHVLSQYQYLTNILNAQKEELTTVDTRITSLNSTLEAYKKDLNKYSQIKTLLDQFATS